MNYFHHNDSISCHESSNKLAQRRMLSTKPTFSDISRDALEGGIKYSPLIVTAIGVVTFTTGITLEFSSLQSQITLASEKIISIEQVNERIMDAKIKSTDEKIKSVELANEKIIDEKVKAIDEKIKKFSTLGSLKWGMAVSYFQTLTLKMFIHKKLLIIITV